MGERDNAKTPETYSSQGVHEQYQYFAGVAHRFVCLRFLCVSFAIGFCRYVFYFEPVSSI